MYKEGLRDRRWEGKEYKKLKLVLFYFCLIDLSHYLPRTEEARLLFYVLKYKKNFFFLIVGRHSLHHHITARRLTIVCRLFVIGTFRYRFGI